VIANMLITLPQVPKEAGNRLTTLDMKETASMDIVLPMGLRTMVKTANVRVAAQTTTTETV
jgi:hypothetical protein